MTISSFPSIKPHTNGKEYNCDLLQCKFSTVFIRNAENMNCQTKESANGKYFFVSLDQKDDNQRKGNSCDDFPLSHTLLT